MRPMRAAALSAVTIALLAGTAACGDSDDSDGRFGTDEQNSEQNGEENGEDAAPDDSSVRAAFEAVQAAAETTAGATSARIEAVTSSPQPTGGTAEVEMTGVMSWGEEVAMDVVASGDALAQPGTPSEVPIRWVDGVYYMDLGEQLAAQTGGKNWLAMDLVALAEESGEEAAADALSFGLDDANQDPSAQLGLLLQSPEIELVGQEELDGVEVDHYRGTISVEDAMASNGSEDFLSEAEREEVTQLMEDQGIESYDIEVWVDENDFPVQTHQSYDSLQGPVSYQVRYSDFGAEVDVVPPPAAETVDFMEYMELLEELMAAGY